MPSFVRLWALIFEPLCQIVLLALVCALIIRVTLRNHPNWRLAGQVAFFVAFTMLLLSHDIVPYEVGAKDARLLERGVISGAKIVWWVNLAWSLIGFVRVFLIVEEQPRSGRLLQDLVVGLIWVGASLSVVAYVFDAPVGTLIATSGIFAIILGLAMQSTLSDVFSGIALNLGRPYGIGDWILLADGIEGRVVQTDWRATYLLNGANDLVIVPNSNVAKARVTNVSTPTRIHRASLTVRVTPSIFPRAIVDAMRTALCSSNVILATPKPGVQIKSLDGQALELELSYSIDDIAKEGEARTDLYDLVFRHAKAVGLQLARPPGAFVCTDVGAAAGLLQTDQRPAPVRLLDALPLFACLSEDEKETLAGTMTRHAYGKGDVIVEQGSVLEALMVIRVGVVSATRQDPSRHINLGRLAPGDYFGEGGLLVEAAEAGTLRAETAVIVYEISKAGLGPLLQERPEMADELGEILSHRLSAERHFIDLGSEALHSRGNTRLGSLIRGLFRIPHSVGSTNM